MVFQDYFQNIFSAKDPLTDILGKEDVKNQVKSALIMNRNIVLVGPAGVGKTTLAKNVSRLLPEITVNDCGFSCDPKQPVCPVCRKGKAKTTRMAGADRFIRIQGSPDLTAEDLIGDIDPIKAMKFGPLSPEAFTPGKIFKANQGILFFDEVNRCPEKLQNSLLQVLEEGKATVGSYDFDLPANFIFIGTMNPDDSSTEKLSDIFLDRVDTITMGYPETDAIEQEIVRHKAKWLNVGFPDDLFSLAIGFVRVIRESKDLEKKPSVRASIGLVELAQANAILAKRKTVTHEDIGKAINSVLGHRIRLKPNVQYLKTPDEFVAEEFRRYETTKMGGDR
ncbi:MAG: ATP-binding protein [archaeon]